MSPPEDPVMRLDHCFAVLVVTDVIHWEWRPTKQKVCQVIYIQVGMEMPESLPGKRDSPSLMQHYGPCTVF